MASGRASISEKQLPSLTGFLLTCSVTILWHLSPNSDSDSVLFSGLDDWGEDAVLHQVLAASQQEYLESLKKRDSDETLKSGKETERKKEDQEGGE